MELTWWEKTVEYKFIMLLAGRNELFLAPMDGNHEKMGDAGIGVKSDLWVMIEFKREVKAIENEQEKFYDHSQAKEALIHKDGHHHIVYGYVRKNDKDKTIFDLGYQTYFSEQSKNLEGILGSGKAFEEFSAYLREFTSYKKNGDSESGGMGAEDYTMVAGVTNDGQVIDCISMSEFRSVYNLDSKPNKTPSP